jgi:pimeloyl-ACP methyl ester carboxylesterase
VGLPVVRLPAADATQPIGSLLLNPGGPGGSGFDFARPSPSRSLRARSNSNAPLTASWPAPALSTVDRSWTTRPPRTSRATWTLLREALGDSQLNYLGYSHGSFLGQVYANLFPDRVRALVIDAVVDPIAWTTGRGDEARTTPFSVRFGGAQGASDTLSEFFRLCDAATDECAFSGSARQRYAAPAERSARPGAGRAGAVPELCRGQHGGGVLRRRRPADLRRLAASRPQRCSAGWGHAAYLARGNFCVDDTVTRYLVTTRTPAAGTVCVAEGTPFGPTQASARARENAARAAALINRAVLPPAVREAVGGAR